MKNNILAILVILIMQLTARSALALEVNYQGVLTDSADAPLNATVGIAIRIYDDATAGTLLYSESHSGVMVINGLFSLSLGGGLPTLGTFDASLFATGGRWLEVEVDGETLAPRQAFLSVPYAANADTLDGLDSSAFALGEDLASEVAGLQSQLDQEITAADLAVDSVTAQQISDNAVGTAEVFDDSLTAADLAQDSVGNSEIAPNAVGSSEVIDESLTAADLAPNSVGSAEIATGAVGFLEVASKSIGSIHLINDSVTSSAIASNAVGASEIANGAVIAGKIGLGAVGSSEIADNSVRRQDLANNAVGSSQIDYQAIYNSHIAPQQIGLGVIADSGVLSNHIAADAIGLRELSEASLDPRFVNATGDTINGDLSVSGQLVAAESIIGNTYTWSGYRSVPDGGYIDISIFVDARHTTWTAAMADLSVTAIHANSAGGPDSVIYRTTFSVLKSGSTSTIGAATRAYIYENTNSGNIFATDGYYGGNFIRFRVNVDDWSSGDSPVNVVYQVTLIADINGASVSEFVGN